MGIRIGKEIATTSEGTKEGKNTRGYIGMKRPKQNSRLICQCNWKKDIKKIGEKKGDSKDIRTGSNNTNKTGLSKITKENSID